MQTPRKLRVVAAFLVAFFLGLSGARAVGPLKIGSVAPVFNYTDVKGARHVLSEYKGRYVVLEWTNQECPFVAKHYDSGNMQALQKELTGEGVFWMTVVSSAPGKPGYVTNQQQARYMAEKKAAPSDVLLDPLGLLGRRYGVTTTPHLFLIDDHGVVIYSGAIDDKPTTAAADIQGAKNFLRAAYRNARSGKPVAISEVPPYGCPVPYNN